MNTTGRTTKQDTALTLLESGPVAVREALAVGGPSLVEAFKQLTKHKAARVTYSAGAYRKAV